LRGIASDWCGPNDWPVLVTEVSPDCAEMLMSLHRLCDWVVTVDRTPELNISIRHGSPASLRSLSNRLCPGTDDLGFLQLITSTSSLDEVVRLLDTHWGKWAFPQVRVTAHSCSVR